MSDLLHLQEPIEKYGSCVLEYGFNHIKTRIALDDIKDMAINGTAYDEGYDEGYDAGFKDAKSGAIRGDQ